MARSGHIRHATASQAELAKILRTVGHRQNLFQTWRDFVACCALAISNSMDKRAFDAREAEYMAIAKRYTAEEMNGFAQGLAVLVEGLEAGADDFLGSLFMSLDLGNAWAGQFFTPYSICTLMAGLNLSPSQAQEEVGRKGFITVNDPCVGGGAMLIAFADNMANAGLNYQTQMHAVGQDIDIVACHMAYVQLSLLHVPAVIVHGNSLMVEERSVWRTPAHMLGNWGARLRRWEAEAAAVELATADAVPSPAVTRARPFVPSAEALKAANDPGGMLRSNRVSQFSLF